MSLLSRGCSKFEAFPLAIKVLFQNCHLSTLIDTAACKALQCKVGRLRQYFTFCQSLAERPEPGFPDSLLHRQHGEDSVCTDVHQKTMTFKLLHLLIPTS